LLALCAPCCTPASLPRWAAPSITVPGNIADRYKLQLLALRHLTKQLEVRAPRCAAGKGCWARARPRGRPRAAARRVCLHARDRSAPARLCST